MPRQKEGKPESRSVLLFLYLSCWVVWGVLLLLLFFVWVLGEMGEAVGAEWGGIPSLTLRIHGTATLTHAARAHTHTHTLLIPHFG